jgi:metallo-beta-lactamase family protein
MKNEKENLTLQFLGGAGTVTGSKFLISHGNNQILLDCGLFQGLKDLRQRNWAPLPLDIKNLRSVVLTHAHIDHSGYLPKLVRLGFRGNVYATAGTCDLLRVLLPDAAHLQEEEAKYANHRGYSKHKPALPLYTVEDAGAALKLLTPVRYDESINLADGLSVQFFRTGHILGSAALRLKCRIQGAERYLVDSGDLGRWERPILRDPDIIENADWLLVESTYGDRVHPENPEAALAQIIRAVADEKGCLIIPAFAVGRTQEILYVIRKLEDKGEIPAIPVHMDSPMAIDATDIYCAHPEDHDLDMKLLMDTNLCPLCCKKFNVHRTQEESKALNNLPGPLIIISASGMITGGRVLHHLKQRLPDPKTTVLLVGFQAEGTRGRLLQEDRSEIKMFGETITVRSKIKTIDGFSAHADQLELLRWLGNLKQPPRKTFVIHGEANAASTFASILRDKYRWDTEIPTQGQITSLR